MKLTRTLKDTLRLYGRNFGDCLLTLLLQVIFLLMALTPLVFLSNEATKPLALLCLPMYALIVLPARQNVAEAMQDVLGGGRLFGLRLISTENYWRKVGRGLWHALTLMLWGALLIGATMLVISVVTGKAIEGLTDGFSLMRHMRALGGGSTEKGAVLVVAIYAATVLPLLLGCAFHSGTRHAYALGDRKLVRGKRLKLIALWLMGVLSALPFVVVSALLLRGPMAQLVSAVKALKFSNIDTAALGTSLLGVGVAALVLLLPTISFKQLLPAVFLRGHEDKA